MTRKQNSDADEGMEGQQIGHFTSDDKMHPETKTRPRDVSNGPMVIGSNVPYTADLVAACEPFQAREFVEKVIDKWSPRLEESLREGLIYQLALLMAPIFKASKRWKVVLTLHVAFERNAPVISILPPSQGDLWERLKADPSLAGMFSHAMPRLEGPSNEIQ